MRRSDPPRFDIADLGVGAPHPAVRVTAPHLNTSALALVLCDLCDQLGQARLGQDPRQVPAFEGWWVQLSDSYGPGPYLDVIGKRIWIPSTGLYPIHADPSWRARTMLSLLMGLRFVEQIDALPVLVRFPVPAALYMARAQTADATAYAITFAYRLRRQMPELWHHVLAGPDGDLARIVLDIPDVRDAYRLIFARWGDVPVRRHTVDHQTLDQIDTDVQVLPHTTWQPARAIRRIAQVDKQMLLTRAEAEGWWQIEMSRPLDPVNAVHLKQILADHQFTWVNNVAFRDADLAGRIFS